MKSIFERLQRFNSIEYYEKKPIEDKYIIEFFKRNKNKNISEEVIKNSINERLDFYKPVLDNIRNYNIYFLYEEVGVPDTIHYINTIIISYVKNYINSNRKDIKEGETFVIKIPNNIFDKKKIFFENCKITVELTLYVSTYPIKTTKDLTSEYKDDKANLKTIGDVKKLVNGEIILRICEFECDWQETMAKLIYHEFTHMYQDYNMLLKNQDYKNGKNYLTNKILYNNSINKLQDVLDNPQKYDQMYGKHGGLVIDCCNAIYAINKMEQSAYISQSYSEISDYIGRKGCNFTYEEVIEHTTAFDYIYNLSVFLEQLKNTDEEGIIIVGITMASLTKGKVNNEYECIREYKKLIFRIERTINNLYSKLVKVLGNYCSKNNLLGNHGKINDLYKRIMLKK